MIGALIQYHQAFFLKHGKALMLAAAGLFALHATTGLFFPRPIAVAGLTIGAALLLPAVQGPTRWGDFSYGSYVLHWPVIPAHHSRRPLPRSPLGSALSSLFLMVALCAVFSWFVVEKPSLAHAHKRALRLKAASVVVTAV